MNDGYVTELLSADDSGVARAAELIRLGELVAVPTETVYGLAANALDASAAERIYAVKGRPDNKPLSWLVSSLDVIERYCLVPKELCEIAERHWPGPLTVVLKMGESTQAFRIPAHDFTLQLLKTLDIPLACPSANLSGEEPPVNASEVLTALGGRIAAVVDGGECSVGLASTVLDMSVVPYKVLRQGSIRFSK